ncbi:MAG: exodeoxyribonuclease VII small subunit [Opitutales bacterium]|nr:exodeoxyribonuclease VII small subunit [Opitutales bacterium]
MLDKKSKKTPSFEVAMQRLEAIVHILEAGDIPLERLVKTYEEGLAYQKICQAYLERADFSLKRLDDDGTVAEVSGQEKNGKQCDTD